MTTFLVVAALVVLALVVAMPIFFGPPYVPTLTPNMQQALDMLDLQPGQTLLDLGSGDGRVLLAAAERGWNAVGIEISPVLVIVARVRTWKYRKQVRVLWGSYFARPWPPADAVFSFMIQHQMAKLDERIEHWRQGPVRLASFAFKIPGKRPVTEKKGVYLYEYK